MIISRKKEDMDSKLLERFSNEHLIVEGSRKSRLTADDMSRIMRAAFSGEHTWYSTGELAELIRKSVYQMNFDRHLQSELFCAINSVLVELNHVPDKTRHLQEAEKWLSNIFELMFFLGHSEADGFLHDEDKGGWHHPKRV